LYNYKGIKNVSTTFFYSQLDTQCFYKTQSYNWYPDSCE